MVRLAAQAGDGGVYQGENAGRGRTGSAQV